MQPPPPGLCCGASGGNWSCGCAPCALPRESWEPGGRELNSPSAPFQSPAQKVSPPGTPSANKRFAPGIGATPFPVAHLVAPARVAAANHPCRRRHGGVRGAAGGSDRELLCGAVRDRAHRGPRSHKKRAGLREAVLPTLTDERKETPPGGPRSSKPQKLTKPRLNLKIRARGARGLNKPKRKAQSSKL